MKTFKRLTAMVLAIAAMAAGMSSVAAGAMDVTEQMAEISAEELRWLPDEQAVINAMNTTYTMPAYDYYASYNSAAPNEQYLSPTTHYLAALVDTNTSLSSRYYYFYLNMNILSNDAADTGRFSVGRNFTGTATLSQIAALNNNNESKKMRVRFNISSMTTTECCELFTYCLGNFGEDDTAVLEELDLHKYTSSSTSAPDSYIASSITPLPVKCVYSVGDVSRDGKVDSSDATMLLAYGVQSVIPSPLRTAAEQRYDTVAFELAGDCDGSGEIDLLDVITLNKYINGLYDNLPYID